MIKPLHITTVVLLVALALCVGGPSTLFAFERTPEIAITANAGPAQVPSQPQLVTDNGDPDDWASKSDQGKDEIDGSGVRNPVGGAGKTAGTWRAYLEYISGVFIRTRLYLIGIL